jgi:hypothetical protein
MDLSLIDALSRVHSKQVLVNEIAIRNSVVLDGHLELMDFG